MCNNVPIGVRKSRNSDANGAVMLIAIDVHQSAAEGLNGKLAGCLLRIGWIYVLRSKVVMQFCFVGQYDGLQDRVCRLTL